MRVGITGGNGFIGGHVREELARRGHHTVVFDRHQRGQLADTEEFMLGDVRDPTAVFELAAHVEGWIHLAAVLGTQETIQAPTPSAETNILGSLNVFEAAARYRLPGVYAGVGNAWMRDVGTGSYTISKTCAEDYARMHNAYREGRITIVRPVNAYGPRQSVAQPYGASKVRKITPAFVCRALTGTDIEVYGDGTQVSDMVSVHDVAAVFVTALEWTAEHGPTARPVEVGPAVSCTVNDVARTVIAAAEGLGYPPVGLKHLPMRPGEVPNAVVSSDVATLAQIGVDAASFVSLEDGIAEVVAWYAEHWLPGYRAEQA
jgi:UDP-glucose 4-epimerase